MNASELDLSSLGVTEREAREIEREAERRLKPFACGIADCTRRYKNMNGLRYHYQHSGDHGAIGLALLASGQHECLRNGTSKPIRSHTVTNAINAVTASASASTTPGYTPTSTPTNTQAPQLPSTAPAAPAAMPNVYATAAGTLPFSFMPHQSSTAGQQHQQPTAATQSYLAYSTGMFGTGAPASVSPAPLSAAAATMQF
jgi:transcription factor SFP1